MAHASAIRGQSHVAAVTIAAAMLAMILFSGLSVPIAGEFAGAQVSSGESRQARVAEVQALIARDDVARAMVKLGVNPADARSRVVSLSDTELDELRITLEQSPSTGSFLAVLAVLVIVVLVLDLTGLARIFRR